MTVPTRICFVIPAYVPALHFGGPVQKLQLLAQALRRLGCEISVVAGDYGADGAIVPPGRRLVDGLTVIHVRVYARYRWTPILCGRGLSDAIADANFVHIIGYRDTLTYHAAHVSRRTHTPYIVEPVGMWHRGSRKRTLKRAIDRLSLRYFADAAALIATSTEEAASIAHLNTRVVLRNNPVPNRASRVERNRAKNAITAVWIGRLAASKGLPVLLQAMATVPSVRLILAGPDDGDGTASAVRTILERNSALAERVSLLGPIYGSEKARLLSRADFFVLPSPRESFGNAAGEAIAHGVPVLVTSGAGIAPLVQTHNAGVVCEPTAAGIAEGLRQMVNSVRSEVDLSDGIAAMAEKLSPDAVAAHQLSTYLELSGRSPTTAY